MAPKAAYPSSNRSSTVATARRCRAHAGWWHLGGLTYPVDGSVPTEGGTRGVLSTPLGDPAGSEPAQTANKREGGFWSTDFSFHQRALPQLSAGKPRGPAPPHSHNPGLLLPPTAHWHKSQLQRPTFTMPPDKAAASSSNTDAPGAPWAAYPRRTGMCDLSAHDLLPALESVCHRQSPRLHHHHHPHSCS